MDDPKRDVSHTVPDSFQQLVWAAMVSEKTPERRLRKVLPLMIQNFRERVAEAQAGRLTLEDLQKDLDMTEGNLHVIVKGIIHGPL